MKMEMILRPKETNKPNSLAAMIDFCFAMGESERLRVRHIFLGEYKKMPDEKRQRVRANLVALALQIRHEKKRAFVWEIKEWTDGWEAVSG